MTAVPSPAAHCTAILISGLTPAMACAPAAAVLAVVMWMVLRSRGWGRSAFWISVTLVGEACALQLLEVGNDVRLQLFFGWSEIRHSPWRLLMLAAVLLHFLVAAWGTWRAWRGDSRLRQNAKSLLALPQAALLLAILLYACITIAPGVAQSLVRGGFASMAITHMTKVALAMTILLAGAGSLTLAARYFPDGAGRQWAHVWAARNRTRLKYVAALWVVVASSLLAWWPLAAMPHIPDEVSYLFQAKYISTGSLYLPPPPLVEAFPARFNMVDGSRWYSAMLGGWPFLLAVGYKLGVPWLVNPLLGGMAILLAHALARRLYGQGVADGVALLLAFSPWLLFMSANLMPHALSLALFLAAFLGVHAAREPTTLATGLAGGAVAGLAMGAMLHVRPLEAVALATVAGVWWLSAGWKNLRIPALAATLATGLAMTGLFFSYNKALTGDGFYAPVNKFFDVTTYPGSNRLGFGKDIGNWGSSWRNLDALEGHGPIDVFMNSNQNLYLVNFELFGWACGSLLLVWLLFVWGKWRPDALQWGVLAGLFVAMSLYWFNGGPDYGPRYWYQMIFPCAALTIRGAQALARRVRQDEPEEAPAGEPEASRVWAFVAVATLVGAVNVVPWRAVDKYPNYRGLRPDIGALAREQHFGKSLIFVRGPAWPDYHSAMPLNPPRFEHPFVDGWDAPIYARDLGREQNEKVRAYYAERPVWFIAGAKFAGGAARRIAGPVAPGQPLPEDGFLPDQK